MEQPFLSVVIPVYNTMPNLIRTMDSVSDKGLDWLEVICIDDCSSDGSSEVLDRYASGDDHIRIIRHGSNRGTHLSRMEGAEAATGRYIWYIDGDDSALPHSFEDIRGAIEAHDVDILHFGTTITNEGGMEEKRVDNMRRFVEPYNGTLSDSEVFDACFIEGRYKFNIWNKAFRSEVLKEAVSRMEAIDLPKAQDKYEYMIIASVARSYIGIPSLICYEYHFGTGLTGHTSISIGLFSRYCSMALVADAADRYCESLGNPDDMLKACRINRQQLLEDCVANWYRVTDTERAQGFDMMVDAWGADAVVASLSKRNWFNPEGISRVLVGSERLVPKGGPIRTVATYYHRMFNGGVQRVVSSLLRVWVDMGYNVILITDEEPNENDYPIPEEVRRFLIPSYFSTDKTNYGRRATELQRILREEHVDVLINHAWICNTLLWDLLVCKANGVRYLSYCHNVFAILERNTRAYFASLPDTYRLMDGAVVLSRVDERFWSNFVPKVWDVVNPLTVDPFSIEDAPLDSHRVLWLGRMSDEKRPKEAVAIFAEVKKRVHDARLGMVGDGTKPFMDDLRRFIKKNGLEGSVELPGFMSDVTPMYQSASVFLCTSEYEGFLLTLTESMSAGVPSVLYELPYLRIIQEGDGFVQVPQKDVQAAASEICRLLEDRAYRTDLGNRGKAYVKTIASYDHAARWREILEDLESPVTKDIDPMDDMMWNTLLQFYKSGVEKKNRAYDNLKKELDSRPKVQEGSKKEKEIIPFDSPQYKVAMMIQALPADIRSSLIDSIASGSMLDDPHDSALCRQTAERIGLQPENEIPVPDQIVDAEGLSKIQEARMYRDGIDVDKDLKKAAELFEEANRDGSFTNELFDVLWDIDEEESSKRMVELIRPHAEAGNIGAMGRLGRAYREGKGVKKDNKEAKYWLGKAYATGSWQNEYFDVLWNIDTPESRAEMIEVARKGVSKGDPKSMVRLGRAYRYGHGVEKDLDVAISWYTKAADLDDRWSVELEETIQERDSPVKLWKKLKSKF